MSSESATADTPTPTGYNPDGVVSNMRQNNPPVISVVPKTKAQSFARSTQPISSASNVAAIGTSAQSRIGFRQRFGENGPGCSSDALPGSLTLARRRERRLSSNPPPRLEDLIALSAAAVIAWLVA